MKRGTILYWEILDPITLVAIIRVATREEARALAEPGDLIASVRVER